MMKGQMASLCDCNASDFLSVAIEHFEDEFRVDECSTLINRRVRENNTARDEDGAGKEERERDRLRDTYIQAQRLASWLI